MCESMNTESMATKTNSQKLIEMQENNLLCLSVPIENESNIWYKTWNLYLIAIENSIINDVKRQALMELAKDAQEQYTKMTEKTTLQSKKSLKTANKRFKSKDKIPYSNVIWTNIIIKCCIIIVAVILSLDDHQPNLHLSKTKYHVRFIFPQACLLEYVRHAIILNYIKQAHQYRVEGLENEADENYLEASDQCRMLASDLEEQSSIINGREATDVIVNDSEDVSVSSTIIHLS
ncbi:unnamed protein product [Adineta steineri]|uniref:Uncharacterized protein n=1 Tax=Adineta steineri TaxID=433720 RepID=A0A818P4I5_9BILA|nr:unnamed protein product [Adineta steineri]CAF3617995.1 unnamed protein product [Adineta steineri]